MLRTSMSRGAERAFSAPAAGAGCSPQLVLLLLQSLLAFSSLAVWFKQKQMSSTQQEVILKGAAAARAQYTPPPLNLGAIDLCIPFRGDILQQCTQQGSLQV